MSNLTLILFYKICATIYVKVFMSLETRKRSREIELENKNVIMKCL